MNFPGGYFGRHYRWIEAQLALEKSVCANWKSDFKVASTNLKLSQELAEEFHFPELTLRIIGLDSAMKRLQANADGGWRESIEGLRQYWKAEYSTERLYQFYAVMTKCAADVDAIHASEALLRQSIAVFELGVPDDTILTAMLYLRLANLLLGQGHPSLADLEASKAESLLKQIPAGEATAHRYLAPGKIELADFQLRRGNAASALSVIKQVESSLTTEDDFVSVDFYTVLGNIDLHLNRLDDAATAYGEGIKRAEHLLVNVEADAGRLLWGSATDELYRGLVQTLLQQKQDARALAVWELSRVRALGTIPGEHDGHLPLPLEKHVIYASFENWLQVWVTDGRTIESRQLPINQSDLRRRVRAFAESCSNPSSKSDVIDTKAKELYSALVQPILMQLTGSNRIAVELDQSIAMLRMEALKSPLGRYFSEDYEVTYSPGLIAETTLRTPRDLSRHDATLMIDASQTDANPLPGHSQEVNAVQQTFVKTQVIGPKPLRIDAIKNALPSSVVLHFSGHGKASGTGTALVLGPDTSLAANDFAPTYLKRLQLAVLSACSSGLARKGAFDESNLVRSFLSGGVPAVIASGWEVDSRSTAQFMKSFYAHIRSREMPVAALQHAQAEMRAINDHPYYWAAFTLAGRAN